MTTTVGSAAALNDRWCDSGNHHAYGDCVANTDHCDEYNAGTHNCTDCAWYAFSQKNPDTGNYCKTDWWQFLLWGLFALLCLAALIGLCACCLCKKKVPQVEKVPLVQPKPIPVKKEVIKQAPRPKTPVRMERVVVQKSPPRVAETHYMPEKRKVVYGERHERTVYGEPKYYTVGTKLGESHLIDERPGKVTHISPEREVTSRVVRQEPVVTERVVRGEERVVRGDARVVDERVVRGEPHVVSTRVVPGETRVVEGSTRVVEGNSRVVEGSTRVVGGNSRVVEGGERYVNSPSRVVQGNTVVGGNTQYLGGNTVVGGTTYGTTNYGGSSRVVNRY